MDSVTAGFLSIGPAHGILRHWKKHPNARLESAFSSRIRFDDLRSLTVDAVVPVPQNYARSYRLGGGPARRLARTLSRELRAPLVEYLALPPGTYHRLAGRPGLARYETRLEFFGKPGALAPERVLLVDDLLTTGRTFREACRVLRLGGAREIHAWVLGYRPGLHAGLGADRRHHLR